MIRLLALILAASLPFSATASVTAYDPAALARLVDEYVTEMTAAQSDKSLASIAQQEHYAALIGLQVAKLEPDDFNKFSLELVGRYLAKPEERKAIGQFIKGMKAAISADLTHTEMIQNGPTESIVNGMTWYGSAILAGAYFLRMGGRLPGLYWSRLSPVTNRIDQLDVAFSQMSKWRRYGATSAKWLAAGGVGAGLGYLEWSVEMNKTHRLDPEQDLLNVAQANLACDLSYRGLDLEEALSGNDMVAIEKQYPQLAKEAKALFTETNLLLEQFPRLDNLETEDRMLARKLNHLPAASEFQALRKNLVATLGNRANRTCQAVSLTYLKMKVQEYAVTIEFVHQQQKPEEKK